MILTGEGWSSRRKFCAVATQSATNLTQTDMGSNKGLRCNRPVTNRLDQACSTVYVMRNTWENFGLTFGVRILHYKE